MSNKIIYFLFNESKNRLFGINEESCEIFEYIDGRWIQSSVPNFKPHRLSIFILILRNRSYGENLTLSDVQKTIPSYSSNSATTFNNNLENAFREAGFIGPKDQKSGKIFSYKKETFFSPGIAVLTLEEVQALKDPIEPPDAEHQLASQEKQRSPSSAPPVIEISDQHAQSDQSKGSGFSSRVDSSTPVDHPPPIDPPPPPTIHRSIPLHYVERELYLKQLITLLCGDDPSGQESSISAITGTPVGAYGMGGIGKTTLAIAIAHHETIRHRFRDGIYFLEFGQEVRGFERQRTLYHHLTDTRGDFDDVHAGKISLGKILANKRVLLILDDVWHAEQVDAFLNVGTHVQLLITTRKLNIVRRFEAHEVSVDLLDPKSALALLLKSTKRDDLIPLVLEDGANEEATDRVQRHEFLAITRDLVKDCGHLPLAIAAIGATLRKRARNLSAWKNMQKRLEDVNVDRITVNVPDYRPEHGNLFQIFKMSFDDLGDETTRDRYLDLGVFPEDQAIPRSVLAFWWKSQSVNDGHFVDELQVDDWIDTFVDASMVMKGEVETSCLKSQSSAREDEEPEENPAVELEFASGSGSETQANVMNASGDGEPETTLILHDLYRDFIHATLKSRSESELESEAGSRSRSKSKEGRLKKGYSRLRKRHNRLVNAFLHAMPVVEGKQSFVLPESCTDTDIHSPSLAPYYYHHFAWHLHEAGRTEDLKAMLLSIPWMKARIDATDVYGLIDDYRFVEEGVYHLIAQTLSLASHALIEDSRQLATQFLARLSPDDDPNPVLREFLAEAEKHVHFFRPLRRSLTHFNDNLSHILHGHTSYVKAVFLSKDQKKVISCSKKNVKVWDLEKGHELYSINISQLKNIYFLTLSNEIVVARKFLDDEKTKSAKKRDRSFSKLSMRNNHYYSIEDDRVDLSDLKNDSVSVFHIKNVELLDDFRDKECEFTGNKKMITVISGGNRHKAIVMDLKDESVLSFYFHGRDYIFLSNKSQMVTTSTDGTLKLWDLGTGKELLTFSGHTSAIKSMAITPDERRVVTTSTDGTLKLWDLGTGKELLTFSGHTSAIKSMAITPDGRRVVTTSTDGTLKLWDLGTGKELFSRTNVIVEQIDRMITNYDGSKAVFSVFSKHVLPFASSKHLGKPYAKRYYRPDELENDYALRVWGFNNASDKNYYECHQGPVTLLSKTPEKKRIITTSTDGTLKLWDLGTGKELLTFSGHTSAIKSMAITPDGRRMVTDSYDATLRVWDLASGANIDCLQGHERNSSTTITPSGDFLIQTVVADKSYRVKIQKIDNDSFEVVFNHCLRGFVFISHKEQIAFFSGDSVIFFDLISKRVVATLQCSSSVCAITITPDEKYVISMTSSTIVDVWNVEKKTKVKTFGMCCNEPYMMFVSRSYKLVVNQLHITGFTVVDLKIKGPIYNHPGMVKNLTLLPKKELLIFKDWLTSSVYIHNLEKEQVCASYCDTRERSKIAERYKGFLSTGASENFLYLAPNPRRLDIWSIDKDRFVASFSADSRITCVEEVNNKIVVGDEIGRIHFLEIVEPNDDPS